MKLGTSSDLCSGCFCILRFPDSIAVAFQSGVSPCIRYTHEVVKALSCSPCSVDIKELREKRGESLDVGCAVSCSDSDGNWLKPEFLLRTIQVHLCLLSPFPTGCEPWGPASCCETRALSRRYLALGANAVPVAVAIVSSR